MKKISSLIGVSILAAVGVTSVALPLSSCNKSNGNKTAINLVIRNLNLGDVYSSSQADIWDEIVLKNTNLPTNVDMNIFSWPSVITSPMSLNVKSDNKNYEGSITVSYNLTDPNTIHIEFNSYEELFNWQIKPHKAKETRDFSNLPSNDPTTIQWLNENIGGIDFYNFFTMVARNQILLGTVSSQWKCDSVVLDAQWDPVQYKLTFNGTVFTTLLQPFQGGNVGDIMTISIHTGEAAIPFMNVASSSSSIELRAGSQSVYSIIDEYYDVTTSTSLEYDPSYNYDFWALHDYWPNITFASTL